MAGCYGQGKLDGVDFSHLAKNKKKWWDVVDKANWMAWTSATWLRIRKDGGILWTRQIHD